MYTWNGNVGLVNVSDILRASTNSLCTSATTSAVGTNECNSNYLLDKGSRNSLYYWTINAYSRKSGGSSGNAWRGIVDSSDVVVRSATTNGSSYVPRPVVFLKSTISLTGEGSKENPFTIM